MSPTNTDITCAIFGILITLSKFDQGKTEAYYDDAKEISPGRVYYWKDWCFCRATDDLYTWSEAAVLILWIHSATAGLRYIIDGKFNFMFLRAYRHLKHDGNPEYQLQEIRRMIKLTNHTQPILSHAGSTELVVGDWFLISRKEGEMSIQHKCAKQIITLQEDFFGFTSEYYSEKYIFPANTSMGDEFSTTWITGRRTNQLRLKEEALKPKTENQTDNIPNNALTEIQCNTTVRLHHISYTWNIDRIDLYRPEKNKDHSILSPKFSSATNDKVEWYLEIEPGNKDSDDIGFYLHRDPESKESKIMANFTIYFFDNERNLMETYCSDLDMYDNSRGWGWDDISFNEVVSSDNKLRMVWNITFCESTNSVCCTNRTHTISNHKCIRTQDFVPTIKNIEFPDIVLVLSKTGKEYPANKAILATSSPVFAAMFNISNTEKGKKIDRVNITDVDSDPVFDEILKYIYTGKCKNIENLTNDLLLAARKYKLDGLKTSCIEKIRNNLTVENAVDTLILADEHDIGELKSIAIRFIAGNYAQVSNTSDWKQIVKTNSEFVHEVCQMLSNSLGNKEIAEE